MKKIALTLLVACLCLEAGCSRPTAEAPVAGPSPTPRQLTRSGVDASPIPRQLTEEEKRKEEAATAAAQEKKRAADVTAQPAVPMTEALTQAASPSPSSSPRQ